MSPRPEVVLPPGFALRIDYDPAASPASLLITAYLDDAPVGQAHVDPRDVGLRLRLEVEEDRDRAPATAHVPRLRLTPQRGMQAIVMETVREPAPPRLLLPRLVESAAEPGQPDTVSRAMSDTVSGTISDTTPVPVESRPPNSGLAALHELAREGSFHQDGLVMHHGDRRPSNALVWLANGGAVVLPIAPPENPLIALAARVGRQLRDEPGPDERAWSRFQRAWHALSGVAAELLANPLRLREADEVWPS